MAEGEEEDEVDDGDGRGCEAGADYEAEETEEDEAFRPEAWRAAEQLSGENIVRWALFGKKGIYARRRTL